MREPLLTFCTLERFFPSVNNLVCLQMMFQREPLITHCTGEWFLSSVNSLVGLQLTWIFEALPTELTEVRFVPRLSSVSWMFIFALRADGALLLTGCCCCCCCRLDLSTPQHLEVDLIVASLHVLLKEELGGEG